MELQVQTLKLMALMEVQGVELEQFQEDQAVVSEQVTPLQLVPLKAIMVVLEIDVYQHTPTEAVVVEHPQ